MTTSKYMSELGRSRKNEREKERERYRERGGERERIK